MESYIVTALTEDLSIRAYCVDTTKIVQRAHDIHKTTPLCAAALGRTLTATSMMGFMLKNEQDNVTVKIDGDGEIGTMICVSDYRGNVRGYIANPNVSYELNAKGKLDVARGVGNGEMTVIKDVGMKQPYASKIPLVSGEIAEDITSYFALSEQVPTVCALGVLVDVDLTIKAAGGYIIQLLPFTPDEVIDKLEKDISESKSVTQLLSEGKSCEEILQEVLKSFPLEYVDKREITYQCKCTKDRVERAIISLGAKEINDIINEQGKCEIGCQFCDHVYILSKEELLELSKRATR